MLPPGYSTGAAWDAYFVPLDFDWGDYDGPKANAYGFDRGGDYWVDASQDYADEFIDHSGPSFYGFSPPPGVPAFSPELIAPESAN